MKYSQFNTIIPHGEQFALFNSYHQKVILLEEPIRDLIEAARIEGIDQLVEYHPTLYSFLIDEEFLVKNSEDEVERVKKLSKSVDENFSDFYLTINPTMNCNFKCWYCYETHVPRSKLGADMVNKINLFMSNLLSDDKIATFNLSFFGGEPLLYFKKDVMPVIDHYLSLTGPKNIAPRIGFTTNGYLINQEFIDYFDEKGIKCALQITLDGYKEKHDQVRYVSANKGSYEKIVENVKFLVMNHYFVNLRVNYTSDNIEDTNKIAGEFDDLPEDIKSKYLAFDFHRVWQDNKLDRTSESVEENLELIRSTGIPANSGYSANNVRDSCYADKRNSAVINYNGDLFKCTARDFLPTARAGYLTETGDLVWENDYLEKRMNIKFKNKPCLSCKIMPLCNGGCTQHALENLGKDYCVYFGDEKEKDKVVKTKVEELIGVC